MSIHLLILDDLIKMKAYVSKDQAETSVLFDLIGTLRASVGLASEVRLRMRAPYGNGHSAHERCCK